MSLPTSFLTILYFFFTFLAIKTTVKAHCTTFTCGDTEIRYPFWLRNSSTTNQLCGYPELGVLCTSSNTSILPLSNNDYTIKSIDYSNYIITLVDIDVTTNLTCPRGCHNISLEGIPLYFKEEELNATNVNNGFLLDWRASLECEICEISRGLCGYNNNTNQKEFLCFCDDHSTITNDYCKGAEKGRDVTKLIIIVVTIPIVVILAILIICYFIYKKHPNARLLFCLPRKNKDVEKLEDLIKQIGSTIPRRYTYSDILKITNTFQEKIGKGGHGDVYKGYLSNGHVVAVKVTKLSGEEFINEVASISTTSHVNIVSLLGFCLDGKKCAQVFDFMPNGSLEKYLHKESNSLMGVEKLYKIAVGVARGLLYLHAEHNSIVHLDIKPHNVLLDEDFCPKISDFGLAIICDKKESILAQLRARGTIGYIAPEFFTSTMGIISPKTDIYSYGMMILEMIGARNNPKYGGTSNTTEKYFPDWVYQRITYMDDKNNNLQADTLANEDNELERKMLLVGLWCIQTNPLDRPDSEKVIEMLEGSIECIEIPPKPELPFSSTFQKEAFMTTSLESNLTTLSSSLRTTGDYTKEHKVDITNLSELSYSSNVSLSEIERVDAITWPR